MLTWITGCGGWNLDKVEPPWGSRPGIFSHIRARVGNAGMAAPVVLDDLPDETRVRGSNRIGWVAGGLDNVWGHHGGSGPDESNAKTVFNALRKALAKSTTRHVKQLYESMLAGGAISTIDPLLELVDATP